MSIKCALVKIKSIFVTYIQEVTDLFLSEGAFAFSSDVLTVSHHHEVLRPSLLFVAGAGVWVQLGPFPDEVFPVGSSCLGNNHTHCHCHYHR